MWGRYADALDAWAADNGARLPYVPEHCEQSFHMFYVLLPSLLHVGSSIDTFRTEHLSTVNNIDERSGKLALAILLSDGTVAGDFGAPPAATWLPAVPPAPTTGG